MAAITPARRTLFQFLKRDPETFPCLAIVGMTTGVAGYFMGDKLGWWDDDANVRVAEEPWSKDAPSNAMYKYRFYQHGNPQGKLMDAPNAMIEFDARVNAPKTQVPKQMLA